MIKPEGLLYISKQIAYADSFEEFEKFSNIIGIIEKVSIYVPKGTADKSFSIDWN